MIKMVEPALEAVYGANVAEQRVRFQRAQDQFVHLYGPGDVYFFRAPGRVNLIGEHTDYNNGYVFPLALEHDILLLARPRADATLRLHNSEPGFTNHIFTIRRQIRPGPQGDWSNYVRGAAQALAIHLEKPMVGLDCLIVGSAPFGVPRGAGLSSSSALTVAAALALVHFNGGPPDRQALAHLCADAEWYVGTRGGIMDHFISLLGQRDHALFLDCRPEPDGHYRTEQLPLPSGYRLLIANSGVRHNNTGGEYNYRVAACRAGVALLQSRFPGITQLRDVQDIAWEELAPLLPSRATLRELASGGIDLGDLPGVPPDAQLPVRRRCRHVWTENRRVLASVTALRAGDAAGLGELLNEAHQSARDDYNISCPELDTLVDLLRNTSGVLGARLTGAGWGGCAIALVEAAAAPAAEKSLRERYRAATGIAGEMFDCRPGPGAGFIMQA